MRLAALFSSMTAVTAIVSLTKRSENLDSWKRLTPASSSLEWRECGRSARYSCALFEVPLDYNNPSAGKGYIGVAKYAAKKAKRVGTLFTNPGGPGVSGLEDILVSGAQDLNIHTGGRYDVISWDPRGVGNITFPGGVKCFNSKEAYYAHWGSSLETTFEVRGNFTDEDDIQNFYSQMDDYERRIKGMGKQCASVEGGRYLQYVGTTATVRDMVALADAIDGRGKLINFWGFSYGTVIGSFFVNMFPHRVGRVVLDGCQDPKFYAATRSDLDYQTMVESTDEAFQGFANECALAGPSRCILADTKVNGGKDIMKWVQEDIIDFAYDLGKAGLIPRRSSAALRSNIWSAMYNPEHWSSIAKELYSMRRKLMRASQGRVEGRDLTHRLLRRNDATDDILDNTMDAIICGDSVDRGKTTTKMVFDEFVRVAHKVSGTFGPTGLQPQHKCHAWPARAVERFQGPFNRHLANPILVVGKTIDPVTPFINAKALANELGDSATLVRQNGFGHASLARTSKCMSRILINFWINGILPKGDATVCEADNTNQLFSRNDASIPNALTTSTSPLALDTEMERSIYYDATNKSRTSNLRDEYESGTGNRSVEEFRFRLDQLEEENKTLLISTIAFAGVACIMLIGLVVQFMLSRGERPKYRQISQVIIPQWNS